MCTFTQSAESILMDYTFLALPELNSNWTIPCPISCHFQPILKAFYIVAKKKVIYLSIRPSLHKYIHPT